MVDQRKNPRQFRREEVYLELMQEVADDGVASRIVACETVDISTSGLKLYVAEPLVIGTILNLSIIPEQDDQALILIGEVKWCRPGGDGGWYFVGMEIYESEDSDYAAMVNLLS